MSGYCGVRDELGVADFDILKAVVGMALRVAEKRDELEAAAAATSPYCVVEDDAVSPPFVPSIT